jgi:outer membrane protein assembly factor BamB
LLCLFVAAPAPQSAAPQASAAANEELWEAARSGDLARLTQALERGADVHAKTRYGVTALTFAADRGHVEIVKLLLERGADVNAQDTFYKMRALDIASMNGHSEIVQLLLERGSKGAAGVLASAAQQGNLALVKAALASSDITRQHVNSAIAVAKRGGKADALEALNAKLAAMPADAGPPPVVIDPAVLRTYAGTYRNPSSGMTVTAAFADGQLTLAAAGNPPLTLVPTSQAAFRAAEFEGLAFSFSGRGGMIETMTLTQNNATQVFERVAADAAAAAAAPPPAPATAAEPKADRGALAPAPRGEPRPWPGFRGDNAAGSGDGQGAVAEWDVETNRNVLWKTPVAGISNSSPIVWGERVLVVTAISSAGDKTFRTGLYGDVAPVKDLSEHAWKILCLDKATGKVRWEQTVFTGVPRVKRHTKASQANSTPVTDGKRVVALFGSIGLLAAWDMDGKPLWTQDVGVLDSGWFFDPEYQWGHSSSPVIYRHTVIVQADRQKQSYIAAYDLDSGKQVWRTERDEIPTWGTPALFRSEGRDQIVTNGPKIRAYDPANGKLLWTLGPNSEITVGTPVVGDGLVYVTGGYPPVRPIYAVRPTASGDITITKEQATHDAIAWSNEQGTYIPSPLFYRGILYTCGNNGIVTAYEAKTGKRLYRARIGGGGSYAASPVAADGRLYFANEDGEVYVVRAGDKYEELAKNEMKEVIMSTPAISDGVIIVRTLNHVYAIGANKP